MVGLDWLDLDFFFITFLRGRSQNLSSAQKRAPRGLGPGSDFGIGPKMRTWRAWGRHRGRSLRRGLPKVAPCLLGDPCALMGPWGPKKGPKWPFLDPIALCVTPHNKLERPYPFVT